VSDVPPCRWGCHPASNGIFSLHPHKEPPMTARLFTLLLLAAAPVAAQTPAADSSYAMLVGSRVARLTTAGHRSDQTYFAFDSTTLRQFQIAGLPTAFAVAPFPIGCPSVGLTPASVATVGYDATVTATAGRDSSYRIVVVHVSCVYDRPDGRPFSFSESATWEIHRTGDSWVTTKLLHSLVT
jgi:hypothetical protein